MKSFLETQVYCYMTCKYLIYVQPGEMAVNGNPEAFGLIHLPDAFPFMMTWFIGPIKVF